MDDDIGASHRARGTTAEEDAVDSLEWGVLPNGGVQVSDEIGISSNRQRGGPTLTPGHAHPALRLAGRIHLLEPGARQLVDVPRRPAQLRPQRPRIPLSLGAGDVFFNQLERG